jgi:hypothetical protein
MVPLRTSAAVLLGLLAVSLVGATSAQAPRTGPLAGSYVGQYKCDQRWVSFNVTLRETSQGTTIADVVFPRRVVQSRRFRRMPRSDEPQTMKGRVDAASSALTLRSDDDLQLTLKGPERKVTLEGSRDPSSGYLVGKMDYPGCDQFVLVPSKVRAAAYAAQLYVQGQKREDRLREREVKATAAREERVRSGWISPELRPNGGPIEYPEETLTYVDAAAGRAPNPFEAIRPIEQLFQRLLDGSYKCLTTATVAWRGTQGSATTPHFTTKSYVVECDGDCGGVTYKVPVRGYHAGRSRAYPLITAEGGGLTEQPLPWEFTRPDSPTPPRVRIHTWSSRLGDYGGGCRID